MKDVSRGTCSLELRKEKDVERMVKRRPTKKEAKRRHEQANKAVMPTGGVREHQSVQADNPQPESGQTKTEINGNKETPSQYKPGERCLLILGLIVSTVGLFVLGIYTYFTYQQWQTAERSLRIAEQSAQGYLSIAEIRIETLIPSEPVALLIVWKNDGNTPITIEESISKVGIVPTCRLPIFVKEIRMCLCPLWWFSRTIPASKLFRPVREILGPTKSKR